MVDLSPSAGLAWPREMQPQANCILRLKMWRRTSAEVEDDMTTFDDREQGFEKKFAHDQELRFKAEARRNKMLGEWVAAKLGLAGAAVEDYVKSVRKADLAEKGDDDVFRKVAKDLADKGVKVADADIRRQMSEFLAKAVGEIEGKK